MKLLIILIFISTTTFSQQAVFAVEEKGFHTFNNPNYQNEVFVDINNVLDKFLGNWIYANEYYDEDNRQDALNVNLLVIKNGEIILNTDTTNSMAIAGASFNPKDSNSVTTYFSEISTGKAICGHVSAVTLTYEGDTMIWEIEPKELMFNRTAQILPRKMIFKKD